ncbi:MAG: hemolysin III family protein [Deltaproteobacteria bacterium]|nr:hemolysin III family protein [Deltaproteobacteria bacterium]
MRRADRRWFKVKVFKDPWSAWTHFLGGWMALFGAVYLVFAARGNDARFWSMAFYGVTLVTLFGASSVYHFFDIGERGNRWLRRVDHAAIFTVIAGTYVPAVVYMLDGSWRTMMLWAIGLFAFLGIIFKTLWIDCPPWLGASIYIVMAGIAVIPGQRMFGDIDPTSALWLGGGCLAYLLGAVVFVKEWPDPWPETFGFHEVWHLFVLAGASAHFAFMVTLLDGVPTPF